MNRHDRTLYTELQWDWARAVAAGCAKLSAVLKTFPSASIHTYKPSVDSNPYYILDGEPSVPESCDETLVAVVFPESVDLASFEQPIACDDSMTYFHLPKECLDLGRPEVVPLGILVHLAKTELPLVQWPSDCSIEEMIRRTPKHERAGHFGYYHLLAFDAEHGTEDAEAD